MPDHDLRSSGLLLSAYVSLPASIDRDLAGFVLCHGYPSSAVGAAGAGATYPELADRIAEHIGIPVLTFRFRGCNGSEGDFSLGGWLADLDAAADDLRAEAGVSRLLLGGFGTGGALGICAGARRADVAGVAAVAAPADFDDWASHPRRLLQHAREVGAIRSADFPPNQDQWAREFKQIRPVAEVANLAPRPFLVIHGSEDDAVPHFDARVLSDAHGSADMRIIGGAGHALRHDPRAIAILLGWLDRHKD